MNTSLLKDVFEEKSTWETGFFFFLNEDIRSESL